MGKSHYRAAAGAGSQFPLYDERLAFGGLALPRLAKWTEEFVWKRADHVLPVSHVLAEYVQKAGVDDEKITVIPNGIDPEKFLSKRIAQTKDDAECNAMRKELAGKRVIGFVGFCREWHRLDAVMARIAEHPETDLFSGCW